MSGETGTKNKFEQYLAEIKANCSSYKKNISQEEYKKFFSYVKQAKSVLRDLSDNIKSFSKDPNQTTLITNCCEMVLIFTKYILANKDINYRSDRLKNSSILREALLRFNKKEENYKELEHVLSLLKKVYFERFDLHIEKIIGNQLNDNEYIIQLENLRIKFYQAENATECKAVLKEIIEKYNLSPSDKKDLEKVVESYSSIVDKHAMATNCITSIPLSQAGFFNTNATNTSVVTTKSTTGRVKDLIQKFNKMGL